MTRLHFVKKARKDNPVAKKGESYYWWKFAFGRKQFSKDRPRNSQLTQSAYKAAIYDMMDRVDEFSFEFVSPPESIDELTEQVGSFVDELISDLEQLRDEQEEARDAMPEALQYAPTGELLQERYDALDNLTTEIDQAVTDVEQIDIDSHRDTPCPDEDDEEDDDELGPVDWDSVISEAEDAVRSAIDLGNAMI